MAAMQGEGGKKKWKGKCNNCGWPGHWAHKCQQLKKDQPANNQNQSNQSQSLRQSSQQQAQLPAYQSNSKSNNKPVRSVNAVADPGDELNECWSVIFVGNVLQVGSTIWGQNETGASVIVASGKLAAATIVMTLAANIGTLNFSFFIQLLSPFLFYFSWSSHGCTLVTHTNTRSLRLWYDEGWLQV